MSNRTKGEPSLREQVLKKFKARYREGNTEFVNAGLVEKFAQELGFKSSNVSRRLREMYTEGLLEREERPLKDSNIKSVWYRYRENERDLLLKRMRELNIK